MIHEERCRIKSVTSRYFVLSSQRYFSPPYTLVSEFATLGERTKGIFIAPLSPQFEYYVCSLILSAARAKKNFEVIIIDNVQITLCINHFRVLDSILTSLETEYHIIFQSQS